MKKNVLIIEPASSSATVFSFFSYLPLMGTLYLGSILKQNGFNVRVLNENILKRSVRGSELKADFLLLSCLTPTIKRGFEIAAQFRVENPDGKILIGGPHVSFLGEEAAGYVDHVVSGEGENIIVDLLKYGSSEKFIKGSPVKDLDTLPAIDWSILAKHERGAIMPVMTSRGCPFACNFCSVAEMFGRKYRAMSPERVIHEVSQNSKKYTFFYDDNFTADLKRAHSIMDGLLAMKKRKEWMAQVRADVSKDRELVKKMAASGCDRVYIGFESVNTNTLKTLKKGQSPEDIAHSIKTLHEFGIKVHGMFMYGSDADTENVITETRDFVKGNSIDSVQYMVLTPLPGTELFHRIESEGRLIHKDWNHYDGLHVVFWPENFTPLKLQQMSMDSFRKFYSLTNAANEIVNYFADRAGNSLGWVKDRSIAHTYSLKNAAIKAGGKIILKRWYRINKSYMSYLKKISVAKA